MTDLVPLFREGPITCARWGTPLWAQTYQGGRACYREKYGSRRHGDVLLAGAPSPATPPMSRRDASWSAIELDRDWLEQVHARISLQDEVARVLSDRTRVVDRLRRLGHGYVDGLDSEGDYRRHKQALEVELESLVVPEVDAATEAGRLLQSLPLLRPYPFEGMEVCPVESADSAPPLRAGLREPIRAPAPVATQGILSL